MAVLGIGTLVLFGTTTGGSPGPVIENFFETVGVEGFIAAVIGAVLGGYAADQMKTRDAASAATRAVDRHFHEAALTAGGTSIDAPRERPEFRPGFYSTCVTDPTGMLVEALYRDPEPISRDDG